MPIAKVHRISAAAPNDVSGIEAAIAAGRIDPTGVVAILGKTEGNGLVNDFTRGYAALALSLLFERHLGGAGREDLSRDVGRHRRRHGAALDRVRARRRRGERPGARDRPGAHAGAPGRASRPARAGRAGRRRGARRDGRRRHHGSGRRAFRADQVSAADRAAHRRRRSARRDRRDRDTLKSMGLSRAASSLGVAVALGEIDAARRRGYRRAPSLWSGRASARPASS